MCRVLGGVQVHALFKGRALAGIVATQVVRAMAEAIYSTALPLDPLIVVRAGAGQCAVEQLLAVPADINRDTLLPAPRPLDQVHAQLEGGVIRELAEHEHLLLLEQPSQQLLGVVHPLPPTLDGAACGSRLPR